MLFPFFHGYDELGVLLDALPRNEWRRDEAVLGSLILHLVKHGHASRAKSYLNAAHLEFEKTYQFDVLDLLLALHLGEPVSKEKLTLWRRLERTLPVSEPLLLGLYYNAMMAMFVRMSRLEDARVAGQQAISCYREQGQIYLEHFIHIHLADIDVISGRLHLARRGLAAAERCLAHAGIRYGTETEIIEIVKLAIDYECGRLDRVRSHAKRLRESLMNGDSWSELFFQLARITILSTYFLEGGKAAQKEMDIFRADYARRHNGAPTTINVMDSLIHQLEWNPNEAERLLVTARKTPIHSAIGDVLVGELEGMLGRAEVGTGVSPRQEIIYALQMAKNSRGPDRKIFIENAIQIAFLEGQIAPFLENRDVFLGMNSKLSSSKFARGNRTLSRFSNIVLRQVDQCYVIPKNLAKLE